MTFRFAEAEDGTPILRFIRQLADYVTGGYPIRWRQQTDRGNAGGDGEMSDRSGNGEWKKERGGSLEIRNRPASSCQAVILISGQNLKKILACRRC